MSAATVLGSCHRVALSIGTQGPKLAGDGVALPAKLVRSGRRQSDIKFLTVERRGRSLALGPSAWSVRVEARVVPVRLLYLCRRDRSHRQLGE